MARLLHWSRREILEGLLRGAGLVIAAGLGIPAILTALSPAFRKRRGPDWRAVGPLAAFPVGGTRPATVDKGGAGWPQALPAIGVYVWRPSDAEVVVFSRACTDLGCPVKWDPGSHWFLCPCHGGMFSQDGKPVAGPPSIPLYRYATRVRGGTLEIDILSVPAEA